MTRKDTLGQISDRILGLLDSYAEDTDQAGEAILELHRRAVQLRDRNPELAIEYTKMGYELAGSAALQTSPGLDSTLGAALSLMWLGAIYTGQDMLEQAADCFFDSAERFRSNVNRISESIAWFALAQVREQVRRRFDWSGVLGAYQQALSALKDTTRLSMAPPGSVEQLGREIQDELNKAIDRMEEQKLARPARPPAPRRMMAPGFLQIPVVARIAAGEPILAYEDDEEVLAVDEDIARDANVAVRIQGNSMVGAGILDGDYVLIREQPTAYNRDIVAVVIRDLDTEATLKRYFRYPDHILLRAENPTTRSIVIVPDEATADRVREQHDPGEFDIRIGPEVIIRGKAVSVIRRL